MDQDQFHTLLTAVLVSGRAFSPADLASAAAQASSLLGAPAAPAPIAEVQSSPTDLSGKLKASRLRCEALLTHAKFLFGLLTDIETIDATCKQDDALFRERSRRIQQRRFSVAAPDVTGTGIVFNTVDPEAGASPASDTLEITRENDRLIYALRIWITTLQIPRVGDKATPVFAEDILKGVINKLSSYQMSK